MRQQHRVLDPAQAGNEAQLLRDKLSRLVVGQDEAVEQIVNIYQMHMSGLAAPGRPVGSFLFLGPTGSGKTRTVEATAEALVNDPRAVIKIDCAEFQHSHEIAKLIGSPPGYLGHRETHALLSQEVLDQHHTDRVKLSFLLFDEIEKASDALWNLLLGILDKATLTLGDNRRVDFSRTMIFMTSNLGAAEMSALSAAKLGFERSWRTEKRDEALDKKMSGTAIAAARRKFTPEFMNRIDKIVVFKPLGEGDLHRILDIELGEVQQRILSSHSGKSFALTVSETAKQFLLEQGTDTRYGARHLKRAIERLIVHPLSNLIATNQVNNGDWIEANFDRKRNCLMFTARTDGRVPTPVSRLLGQQSRTSAAAA
jgi:ATP-dependent Clp protease ATP-binding subunit ClpB